MTTSHVLTTLGLALVMSACAAPGGTAPPSVASTATATASPGPAIAECSPGQPMPSGVVELYFPCGAPAELRPVVRGLSSSGDDAVAEVVRLLLAGPNAQERLAGFGPLLSPRDIEIVEMADGRLVLDFPAEVNGVSTSAGSGMVLESLRRTLIPLDGVEEIELRLRNDCAAFFEWIQVGPACHLLTTDGVVPAPTGSVPAIRVPACEHATGAYRVTLPEEWWTNPPFEDDELGPVSGCRFFGPAEFDAAGGDRDHPIPEGTAIWIDFLDGGCVGYINPILTSRQTTVAGYPTTVSELTFGKDESGPPFTYEYVVALTPDRDCETGGRYIQALTGADLAGAFDDNRAVLDTIMESIEVRLP